MLFQFPVISQRNSLKLEICYRYVKIIFILFEVLICIKILYNCMQRVSKVLGDEVSIEVDNVDRGILSLVYDQRKVSFL